MMKTLSLFILLLAAVFARAANPAFTDFNANQFNTSGNKVAIKSGALVTNAEMHGVRSSDGTPGADAITGGVSFKDGFYVSGAIFGTNWVTNAISAVYSNGIVKGTNINALDLRRGPDIIFQVVSGAVQSVAATALVINDTGSGGLVRSNAPNLHAPTLDGTNLTTQIDAQIDAKGALLLQSATNYANGVTNSSLVRQTQATALSNALVTYANSVTNASIARQTQLTAMSNIMVALSYSLGAEATNYANAQILAKLIASNGVWVASQSGKATNLAIYGATLPTLTASRPLILNSSGNPTNAAGTPDGTKFLRDDGTLAVPPGGATAIATNPTQFGASVTITIKDGAFVTNVVIFGQTNVGNADFSKGLTNYSATLPVHSGAGFTSGNGTEYGLEGFLDPSTGFLLWFSATNVFATMTNRYIADHLPSPGDCWKIKSTNGYEILWTNGPCGGSEVWTNSQNGFISPVGPYVGAAPIQTNAIKHEFYRTGPLSYLYAATFSNFSTNTDADGWLYYNDASIGSVIQSTGAGGHGANIGAYLYAARGLANAAGVAFAEGTVDGGTNVGFAATASTGGFGGDTRTTGLYVETTVAGYGDNPLIEDAVALFDNRDSRLPLIIARTNNGTTMFRVGADGSMSLSAKTNRYSDDGSQLLRDGVPVAPTNATVVQIITNLFVDNITIQKGGTFVGTQFVNITVVTNIYGTTTFIASNAASFQLDFTPGVGTTHYQMTNMANNFTINLTNLYTDSYGPRDAWFYFETDSTGSRTVTVSTNGMTTGTRISWGFNSVTNGATAFTVTNRARLNLVRNRPGVVSAAYEFQQ